MSLTTGERTRAPWRLVLAVLTGASLLVGGIWVAHYRVSYGYWPWTGQPTRLSWCDRDYQRDGEVMTRAQVVAESGEVEPVRDAPPLPGSVQLYAPISQPPLSLPGEPCAMEVYLRTGPDSYVQYGILGGP